MNVFTYGSLMFPEVWERVTGLTISGVPARLPGYTARCLRGQSYPGLVEEAGSVTNGMLYTAITPEAVARLDAFEGSLYERVAVGVDLDNGTATTAWVYLTSLNRMYLILPERWDAEHFAREGLSDFLRDDPGFSEGHRDF